MIAQAPLPPAPPALTVTATVVARWHVSRLTGRVVLAGTAGRPATLRVVARTASGRRLASARLATAADGRLAGRLALPARMAPGAVVVTADEPAPPAGEAALPVRELRLDVPAPPEGVAGRAALTRRRSALVLTVRLLAVPRAGMPLTVRVRRPDGGVRTLRNPSRRGRLVVARLPLAAVPEGRWTARLDAGDRPVVLVTRRFPAADGR